VENNVVAGGFGSAVLEYIATQPYHGSLDLLVHGLPANEFVEHGNADELLGELDLLGDGIARVTRQFLGLPQHIGEFVSV